MTDYDPKNGIAVEKDKKYWTHDGSVVELLALRHPQGGAEPFFVGSNGCYYTPRGLNMVGWREGVNPKDLIGEYDNLKIIRIGARESLSLQVGKSYHTASGKLVRIEKTFCVGNTAQDQNGKHIFDPHNWTVFKGSDEFLYTSRGAAIERLSMYGLGKEMPEDLLYEYGSTPPQSLIEDRSIDRDLSER